MKDSLGDRMKSYEDVNRNKLMSKSDVIIRIDGKAFHSFTRGLAKPYDRDLIDTFTKVVNLLKKQISGFKLAYIQSDEISIWINDKESIQTQGRFYYNINKINSVCASLCTGYFNKIRHKSDKIAFFDCRCFNIPEQDIANYFLWRAKDWYRNSVQMFARSVYSQKQLHGKHIQDIKDMLFNDEYDWDDIDSVFKNGTFITKDLEIVDIRPNYESINNIVCPLLVNKI